MIRVMLVDDQRLARLGFQLMLDDVTDITVIASAESGQAAIDTLKRLDADRRPLPDVILMDVRMPGMDGIEATRHIVKHWPAIRILILTTYDEDDYAFGGLDAGASGFLLKDVTKRGLVEAIRSIAGGDAILTPRITRQVLERGIPHPAGDLRQRELRASFDTLTPRQREICSLVAEGLSNEEIAGRLVIESGSVKRAVSRILTALGLRDRTQIAVSWYKAGLH